MRRLILWVSLLAVFLWLGLALPPAHAAGFTVNSTGDGSDANPGNGIYATSGGVCTVRAAIQEANALAEAWQMGTSLGFWLSRRAPTCPVIVIMPLGLDPPLTSVTHFIALSTPLSLKEFSTSVRGALHQNGPSDELVETVK